jgi:hypothetical protein
MKKISRKGLELLGGLHQPVEDRVGSDLKDPSCTSNAQTFSQTSDDVDDEVG